MNDAKLVMDKIRGELQKGLPSKRKILAQLINLLKKDKYPSLSDNQFYDIVGEIYQLNLAYKLNLNMLFYPIYEELVNKFKKFYGAEKIFEMGQYLSKNFGLFSPEHLVNQIKEEFEVNSLDDLNSKDPEFFMKDYQIFRNNLRNVIGDKRLKEMEEYIIEKYNLHEEEKILFVFEGNLIQNARMLKPIFINSANFYFTNNRIFAQGRLKGPFHFYPSVLGVYGYIIPIKNIFRLRRFRNNIKYMAMLGDLQSQINLKIALGESEEKREILIENLLQALNKEVVQEIAS